MSTRKHITRSCDRCGHEEMFAEGRTAVGWTWLIAGTSVSDLMDPLARRKIGEPGGGDDLCPACADELFAWFNAVREGRTGKANVG